MYNIFITADKCLGVLKLFKQELFYILTYIFACRFISKILDNVNCPTASFSKHLYLHLLEITYWAKHIKVQHIYVYIPHL